MALYQVKCQDCPATWGATRWWVEQGLGDGTVKDPGRGIPYYVSVCPNCLKKHAAAKDNPRTWPVSMQLRRISDHITSLRRKDSQLSVEEAAELAVGNEMDPRREPNHDFRAYLLERLPRDPSGGTE